MKEKFRVLSAISLAFCLMLNMVPGTAAAKTMKLSAKVTVKVGATKKIVVANLAKKLKAKWSIKSGKKCISLKTKTKNSVIILGKKAGKAVILAKVGKQKLVCTVTVKKAAPKKTTTPTEKPTVSPAAEPTAAPTSPPTATADATPTATAEIPTATPEATLEPSPTPTTPAAFTDTDFDNVPARIQMKNPNCSGTTEEFVYNSTAITAGKTVERKAMIILPYNYDASQKYPVIYALHGYNCWYKSMHDDGASYISWNAAARNKAQDVIMVCPSVCAADPETPQTVEGFDNFINDLIQCLMPAIEEHYPVLTGRENTAIWGFSMGGRESLQIGFSRPDLFGYIAGMCAAPGIHADLFPDGKFKLPDEYKTNTLVMVVKGAQDNLVGDTPLLFHKTLEETDTPHLYYETMGFGGGGHSNQTFLHGYYNFLVRAFPKQ